VELESGVPASALGGVVLAPMGREDIRTLTDLKGKRLAIPGYAFLGGYQTQAYELLLRGVRLPEDAQLEVFGSHDGVVHALLRGQADAGFVRSGIMESMIRDGSLPPDRLKVVSPQAHQGFPFAVSTRLYPEWPFAALPHVDERTIRQIARALLNIESDSDLARAMNIHGFTVPGDYLPVENLARGLRLPPFEGAPDFTPGDVIQRYPVQISLGLAVAAIILMLAGGFYLSRRRLKLASQELARLSRHNALLLNSAGEGIYGVDHAGHITFINPAALAMLGYELDEVLGKRAHRLFHARRPDGSDYPDTECPLEKVLQDGVRREMEEVFTRKNGETFHVSLVATAMTDDARQLGAEVVFQDITRRKAMEHELNRLASTDALTGCANRRHFMEQLDMELSRIRRYANPGALLMMDLDHFKLVNDTYGHPAGDAVLVAFVQAVQSSLRKMDMLGRLGGEEFAVLLPETSLEAAGRLAERLRAKVEALSVEFQDHAIRVTVSIGVAALRNDSTAVDEVLSQGDAALYRAKESGRNRVVQYQPNS